MAPLFYAHRGASADFPEMTLAAYLGAIDQGADGFECDLRLTSDRHVVLWHDRDMKRIAGSDRIIAESTLADLRGDFPILTLDELLDLAIRYKKGLALETKHPVPTGSAIEKRVMGILRARNKEITAAGIRVTIMSFSWRAALRSRRNGFESVFLIAHPLLRFVNPAQCIGPWINLLTSGGRFQRRKTIFTWTVDSAEQLQTALGAGAEVIMTNRPREIRIAYEQLKKNG